MPSSFLTRQDIDDYQSALEQHNKRVGAWNASTVKQADGNPVMYADEGGTNPLAGMRATPAADGEINRTSPVTTKDGQTIHVLQKAVNGRFPKKPNEFKMEDPTAGMTLHQLEELNNPTPNKPGLIARMLKS